MSLPFPAADIDYVRVINATRFELESAGNPSYVVTTVDPAGTASLSPMVFATVGPASDHARRLVSARDDHGQAVLIVSRSAAGKRAMFTVIEPSNHKKLHQRLEVIEDTWKDTDGPI